MDSIENEHPNQQSVYPEIDPVTPELGLGGRFSFSQPQYSVNPSSEVSRSGSEILSDDGGGDADANESPRRKRRRLFEAAMSDYDEPECTLSGENSPL